MTPIDMWAWEHMPHEDGEIPYDEDLIVYKKVRAMRDGTFKPLFIDKTKPFIFNGWQKSEYHPTNGFAPRSINGFGNDAVGGWHSCPLPKADWIADELVNGEKRVWMECKISNYIEYKRPQGIWYLSEWIYPIRILSENEVKEINENAECRIVS